MRAMGNQDDQTAPIGVPSLASNIEPNGAGVMAKDVKTSMTAGGYKEK